MLDLLFLSLSFLLLNPTASFAYLDPSAGNALVYIAVTMVSVVAYAAKSLFYHIIGKGSKISVENDIVIFSEGKNYWNTFKPIVDALIAHGEPFSYYSADIEDPGLTIRNQLMLRRYIGEASAASARLNRTNCKVMLATTPNIGNQGYPISKPAKSEFLAHVFHAPAGVAYYKKGSLDFYDGVCMVGEYTRSTIRYLEQKRGTKTKELVALGLPYWDILLKERKIHEPTPYKTLLVAPSWGEKSFLRYYSIDFIKTLASSFNIIFRPHPQSWKSEPELMDMLKKTFKEFPNITWDMNSDPSDSLSKSDLLISDTSGVRMDYAVIYKKPVLSLEVKNMDTSSYELSELPVEYMDSLADKVCINLKKEDMKNITEIVRNAINEDTLNLENFVTENIANLGSAGEHIAEYLIKKAGMLNA